MRRASSLEEKMRRRRSPKGGLALLVAALAGLLLVLSGAISFRSRGESASDAFEPASALRALESRTASRFVVDWHGRWGSNTRWCTPRSFFRAMVTLWRPRGLIYVKVPKAASSSVASIVDRVAAQNSCHDYRDSHLGTNLVRSNRYAWRVRGESFLLGSVRDPASRAVSRVFWTRVTQQEREPTDANLVKWLSTVISKSWIHPRITNEQYGTLSKGQGGFQINYLNQRRIEPWTFFDRSRDTMVKHPRQVEAMVADVLAQYNFLVVTERMDESVVVLGLLLGIRNLGDLLTVRGAKKSGSFHYFSWRADKGYCMKLAKPFRSPRVNQYLNSSTWYAQNYGDYLLGAAASASLDRTIESLGKERFRAALSRFQLMKAKVEEECGNRTNFQCTPEGKAQPELAARNCYVADRGCGYPCINEVVRSLGE